MFTDGFSRAPFGFWLVAESVFLFWTLSGRRVVKGLPFCSNVERIVGGILNKDPNMVKKARERDPLNDPWRLSMTKHKMQPLRSRWQIFGPVLDMEAMLMRKWARRTEKSSNVSFANVEDDDTEPTPVRVSMADDPYVNFLCQDNESSTFLPSFRQARRQQSQVPHPSVGRASRLSTTLRRVAPKAMSKTMNDVTINRYNNL